MGFIGYYCSALRTAWKHTLGIADFISSVIGASGEWRESQGTPILVPGDYEMTVEALSANTRRASIRLIITHDGDAWNIRNAPKVP